VASEAFSEGEIQRAKDAFDASSPLRLFYGGSIVVQLGSQLYPSVTASVAELVSNAWDADADHAWVSVPFDEVWGRSDAVLQVIDDGLGMDRWEAQFFYLIVGRERRREQKTDKTPKGRLLHGRKGIGKLAAFGTGRCLEVLTQKEGQPPVAFRLSYDTLRDNEPGASSPVTELDPTNLPRLEDPQGNPLKHGTRVRLTELQAKRRPNRERFMLSMRRRFALDDREMEVHINGERLERFDMEFATRFPRDGAPKDCVRVEDDFIVDLVDDGNGHQREVRWWIGFSDLPVKDELLQGVTVLVRGKQAQRAFKFERTGGAPGQLGYEYLVGEVHADWIDDGWDDDGDLISSARDTLQLEDERLQPFIDWGRRRLLWALSQRDQRQNRERLRAWNERMPEVGSILSNVSPREQRMLGRVAERLAGIDGVGSSDVADVMGRVLAARDHNASLEVADEIRSLGDAAVDSTWQRAREGRDIELRALSASLEVRLAVLTNLEELLKDGASPPNLAEALNFNPWIVDLAFDRSAVSPFLGYEGGRSDAALLLSAPPWQPDDAPTVLVASWPLSSDFDESEWMRKIEEIEVPAEAALRLIIPTVTLGQPHAQTWTDTLARSIKQHRIWRQNLAGAAR
jgi:hypothetical protein